MTALQHPLSVYQNLLTQVMNLQHERIDHYCQALKLDGLMQHYRRLAADAANQDGRCGLSGARS